MGTCGVWSTILLLLAGTNGLIEPLCAECKVPPPKSLKFRFQSCKSLNILRIKKHEKLGAQSTSHSPSKYTDNRKLDLPYFNVNGSRTRSITGKTDRLQRYKAQRKAEIKTKLLTATAHRKVSLDYSLILRLLILWHDLLSVTVLRLPV